MPRPLLSVRVSCKEFLQTSRYRLVPASPFPGSATAAPHSLGPHVAAQDSVSTRLSSLLTTLLSCYRSTRGSGTTNDPAAAFPDYPRQIPFIVLAAGHEENPSDLALSIPRRQLRHQPVSPRCLWLLTATASRSSLPTAALQSALPLGEFTL